jgi:Ca-activated chloride channel family protein
VIAADLFLRPEALPVLLLAPLAWLGLRALDRARARRLARTLGLRVEPLTGLRRSGRRTAARSAFALAFFCALLAALGPVSGAPARDVEWRGLDLVLCLDVSRSMRARDVEPDRLARAQREVRALVDRARGDRFALVVFAGEARLVVPLTHDGTSFVRLADEVDTTSVTRGGTDLGAALERALDALERGPGEHAAIVLLTDGEDLGGRGLAAAEACRARGVAVHAVGFGTPRGSKIAVEGDDGSDFLRDRAGRDVVSALDVEGLERIAAATGGTYVDAREPAPLVRLYERRVVPMARTARAADDTHRRRENRYQWPLLAALLLWMLALGIRDRSRR